MRFYWLTIALLVALALALLWSADTTMAAPCEHHRGHAKRVCVKAHRAQVVRDRLRFPPHPTWREIRKRVGSYNWYKAHRVAVCETRANLRWYLSADGTPTGTYVSAMGMYLQTFDYGRRATGYRGRTWPEQVAIAVAAHPITGGWNGWGCRGA